MIKNSISLAQYKLKLHKERGMNSELSILEVAELMDLIHHNDYTKAAKPNSIFFPFSEN